MNQRTLSTQGEILKSKGGINVHNEHSNMSEPCVFVNAIKSWDAASWSIEYFASRFPSLKTSFKLCPLEAITQNDGNFERPLMETDCIYVDGTFGDLFKWIRGEEDSINPLRKFCRSYFACYADYKYMSIMFKDNKDILNAIDWSVFGLEGIDGNNSTLWIGSKGAFTPCHQDSYGFNLVAQIQGKKKWTLFPPSEANNLYPTRIPFEESSTFSMVNVKAPNVVKFPKFLDAKTYEVILEPGDVLFVPKHWWHYVECLEASISVNTWVDLDSDNIDRVHEAFARLLVFSIKYSEGEPSNKWLNPTEEETTYEENVQYIRDSIAKLADTTNEISFSDREDISTDLIINCLTSENVLRSLREEICNRLGRNSVSPEKVGKMSPEVYTQEPTIN